MHQTLFISNLLPWPLDNGGKMRIYHMLRAVAADSEVTLVCFTEDSECALPQHVSDMVRALYTISRQSCRYAKSARRSKFRQRVAALAGLCCHPTPEIVRSWKSDEAVEITDKLRAQRFDLVWGEHLGSINLVSRFPGVRRILDLFDLEHRKLHHWLKQARSPGARSLAYLEYLKLRQFECALKHQYEILVCSELDKQALGPGERLFVVPNGIDLMPGAVSASAGAGVRYVFVGTLDYPPNIDAVHFFHSAIFPRIRLSLPAAQFEIVGRNPVESIRKLHDGTTTILHANVPEVSPHVRQATALVVPIRYGGGTRIKILEGMAHGTPVVSCTVGAEGIAVTPGEDILIADDPEDFAAQCLRVVSDHGLRIRLSEGGRGLIARKYQWSIIEASVRSLVRNGTRHE